ncbi:DUF503 domain-containing protein [Tsukamurella sp. 8F]|uniref:DUF503 domain-containing protein n=1 Tax=unclassified Tsukamurella TaxID=2633480 RepID=UPI0023B9748D|nr:MULTISPECIES: DUF503 domain-containing protein [unclassified Tsukamurella]MDF0532033.1 DUF503 domain-containing protein [Tsukamurella sp. 8J]MDF0587536.1 DUF503 domain-containing protein [Tsukamurella sp. 8F]
MFTGVIEIDLLLGDVRSLKQKRSVVRPILAELRRFSVSVAEVGALDLHRRAVLGVGVVGPDGAHVAEVLDRCERAATGHPEVTVLSVRRRLWGPED